MAYQTNCGLGDKTPEGLTFMATSFAGPCQCGQGGCFGEFGDFIPKDYKARNAREALKQEEENGRETHICDECGGKGHLAEDCFQPAL